MNIYIRYRCNIIIIGAMLVMLYISNGCLSKNEHVIRLGVSGLTNDAETSFRDSINIHDSTTWLDNASLIRLKYLYDGLMMEVSGTADGAIARYNGRMRICNQDRILYKFFEDYDVCHTENEPRYFLEVRLSKEMWLDVLRRLFNSGISADEWKERTPILAQNCPRWKIFVYLNNKLFLDSSSGSDYCCDEPLNLNKVTSAINSIIKDIVKIPLDKEHQNRFDTPISDFENSIVLIEFEDFLAFRRTDGVIYNTTVKSLETPTDAYNWSTLDVSNWLDLVHILDDGTCQTDKIINTEYPKPYYVRIERYNENFGLEKESISTTAKFKEVIDGIRAKIKKDLIIENE